MHHYSDLNVQQCNFFKEKLNKLIGQKCIQLFIIIKTNSLVMFVHLLRYVLLRTSCSNFYVFSRNVFSLFDNHKYFTKTTEIPITR